MIGQLSARRAIPWIVVAFAALSRSPAINVGQPFVLPADPRVRPALRGRRLYLCFEGAHQLALVFVNGHAVGEHKRGYTAFCCEITEQVRFGDGGATVGFDPIVGQAVVSAIRIRRLP